VAVSPLAPIVVETLVDAVVSSNSCQSGRLMVANEIFVGQAAEDSKHKLGRQHRFWVIIHLRVHRGR
jgi:hypothetical protein